MQKPQSGQLTPCPIIESRPPVRGTIITQPRRSPVQQVAYQTNVAVHRSVMPDRTAETRLSDTMHKTVDLRATKL